MKRLFEIPDIQVIQFAAEDVIVTSGEVEPSDPDNNSGGRV